MDNKSLSHVRWKCQYHIVFIPKYRKKVLYGQLRNDVREIISTLCKYKDVEIIDGAVCMDHIHLSVAIPPKYSISKFMGYLKGKSTLMIYDRHPKPPLEVVVMTSREENGDENNIIKYYKYNIKTKKDNEISEAQCYRAIRK